MKNASFETVAQQFVPVTMTDAEGETVVANSQKQVDKFLAQGYKLPQASANSGSRARTAATKRPISKQEALQMADRNLAESLGIPSPLAALPITAKFSAKVVGFIGQVSRRTGGNFPSTQIEGQSNGQPWKCCILFDATHELNADLSCSFVELDTEVARSGRGIIVDSIEY